MRRSTAAAVGTLTGAALIIGVRLSIATPATVAAPAAVDLSDSGLDSAAASGDGGKASAGGKAGEQGGKAGGTDGKTGGKNTKDGDDDADTSGKEQSSGAAGGGGLTEGVHKGTAVKNPYGTIQVSIKVSGGKITAADATYPTTADSARINPPAITALKQETLQAQSADIDAVSGATFTSESYVKSLQAALDKAGA
ncbi:FMN-binding protein [Actinoplanes sp. N902-109]|uniref:FMN-binding protein n=1 Tax=Actinoplanes sp. (strain N902-109) TaxID=649831 RepID=UPI0003295051|nr:FMN-binding protein [Actinoplanes sp. N902-109]AGL20053.1 hypothetical protein L083_6543 [Actinoplanes sp. N902-109]